MLSARFESCLSKLFLVVPYLSAKSVYALSSFFSLNAPKDRENEARFGATPVPGKIGMAMAGQGLHAAPPPRPPSHNHFGSGSNPGNQLYVGNVRF